MNEDANADADTDDDSIPPVASFLGIANKKFTTVAATAAAISPGTPVPPSGNTTPTSPAPPTGATNPLPSNPPVNHYARRVTHFTPPLPTPRR